MDNLQMMRVFVRVSQRSSFAAAARELRMSRASVTKHVAAIESRVGVRLLDRTTRSVRLTEAGRIYLDRCLECLQSFDDAEDAVSALSAEPRGLLRVAAPFDLNRHLPKLIASFAKTHPAILLDLKLSNRTLDMVQEGIDVYVRVTNSLDADSIVRPLATTRMAIWGSRAYFRKHGRPRSPAELAKHRFALFDEPPLLDEWTLERDGKKTKVKLRPTIVSNSGEALLAAACAGAALTIVPSILMGPEHAGLIEPALPDWSLGQRTVSAVYPHRRFVPSKVHVFVEALRSVLGAPHEDPWWPASVRVPGSRAAR